MFVCKNIVSIFFGKYKTVLWSRSWSRKEPELLAGAGAGSGIPKFWLPAPAPGQTKVVYFIIIPIE
jgi:hypothetical protein